MRKLAATLVVACFVLPGQPGQAWNKPGHMTSAAIAYADLQQRNPAVLAQVVEILKHHPYYESKWAAKLNQVPEDQRDLYLFMLAARWPDDARSNRSYNHPTWHYVNIPFSPGEAPGNIPEGESIITAFPKNLSVAQSASADNKDRAVAISWMLHLLGDVHQPLHATNLVNDQFPGPQGDRGGTHFYVRLKPDGSALSLHQVWDGLILGSDRFQSVRNEATELRNRPGFSREDFAQQLAVKPFNDWAKDSYAIAVKDVYFNGTLAGGSDEHDSALLPDEYAKNAKAIAERQIMLSGYRISDEMVEVFAR